MEINDYVRTKNGIIGKYIQPDLGKPYITNGISFNEGSNYGKHSKDIIDLIEVGDYVNGWLVYEVQIIDNDEERTFVSVDECYDNYCGFIYNKDIKEILTKEQYQSNVYKIGGIQC